MLGFGYPYNASRAVNPYAPERLRDGLFGTADVVSADFPACGREDYKLGYVLVYRAATAVTVPAVRPRHLPQALQLLTSLELLYDVPSVGLRYGYRLGYLIPAIPTLGVHTDEVRDKGELFVRSAPALGGASSTMVLSRTVLQQIEQVGIRRIHFVGYGNSTYGQ